MTMVAPIQSTPGHEPPEHQVKLVQVSWTDEEPGVPGALRLQLLLDHELREYVVCAAPENAATLVEFLLSGANAAAAPGAPSREKMAAGTPSAASSRWAEASFMRT